MTLTELQANVQNHLPAGLWVIEGEENYKGVTVLFELNDRAHYLRIPVDDIPLDGAENYAAALVCLFMRARGSVVRGQRSD